MDFYMYEVKGKKCVENTFRSLLLRTFGYREMYTHSSTQIRARRVVSAFVRLTRRSHSLALVQSTYIRS